MREPRRQHLAKDLIRRLKAIRKKLKEVRALHPDVVKRYRRRAPRPNPKSRVADRQRRRNAWLKEISFFADRADVSEELTRLESISPNSRITCAAKSRWAHIGIHTRKFRELTPGRKSE